MFLGLITYPKLIFLCAAVFLAGFIDSIAGGGGIISIPAYLLTGLDPKVAFACNKTSACLGTTLAAGKYIRSGEVNWTVAIPSAIAALVGARIASLVVLALDPAIFQRIILFVLPFVAIFLIFKRDFGSTDASGDVPKGKMIAFSILIGLLIAFYDGLVGPGTGTFAIIAFCSLCKLDLKKASGSAKIFNWASNFASMISFILAGKVIWAIALITAACSMAGNFMGASMAIKKNPAFIRVMLTVVCGLLLLKLGSDVLF
ncbi:MAG: TSUP family transporter [Clostridia bacterium]|nr:TSUP family transporter [Clostridia bacterium]